MSLISPILRQVFSSVRRAVKTYSEGQIHLQLVPEQVVINSLDDSVVGSSDLENLCYSVYDRILQPVDRAMSRRFFEHGEQTRGYIEDPRFVLARPVYNKVKYVREMPIKSLDVVDRYTLLHVGYRISPCGKWILAACVDQRAEAHELGVWLMQNEGGEGHTFAVAKVWEFVVQFAKRANVEWRIVIAKLGGMSATSLNGEIHG
jgi:mediator of RNA polymerase II transcription subunit 13, fungi type